MPPNRCWRSTSAAPRSALAAITPSGAISHHGHAATLQSCHPEDIYAPVGEAIADQLTSRTEALVTLGSRPSRGHVDLAFPNSV